MDDQTLDALQIALAASPQNIALLCVLVSARVARGESQAALELLESVNASEVSSPSQRLQLSNAALASGALALALEFATGETPELRLARAHALVALGRREEARATYESAVSGNSTLEDPDFAAALRAQVRDVETPAGRPRLRVISNDDTAATEIRRFVDPELPPLTFSDVGGHAEIKKQIERRIVLPFQKPSLFQRFKKRVGGGILLYGPPGCGKTMLARATAGECKATFINVQIADVLDMYIGESEQKLHALFDKARASAPAVLFFDEIEGLGGKRQYSREATSSKLVSQFLSEMDGFAQNNHGVLILGATNVPWSVDAAFRRPGRFDRVLFVPPPDREARRAILELLLADRPTEGDLELDRLSKATTGFSGADLGNIIETAADEAIAASIAAGHEVPIAARHIQMAMKEVKPTTAEWLTTARNFARYSNESGHYDEVLEFLAKNAKA